LKKTLLIVAAISIVVFLSLRVLRSKFSGGKEERAWYGQQLGYDFSAQVDTVIMLKGDVGLGKVIFDLSV